MLLLKIIRKRISILSMCVLLLSLCLFLCIFYWYNYTIPRNIRLLMIMQSKICITDQLNRMEMEFILCVKKNKNLLYTISNYIIILYKNLYPNVIKILFPSSVKLFSIFLTFANDSLWPSSMLNFHLFTEKFKKKSFKYLLTKFCCTIWRSLCLGVLCNLIIFMSVSLFLLPLLSDCCEHLYILCQKFKKTEPEMQHHFWIIVKFIHHKFVLWTFYSIAFQILSISKISNVFVYLYIYTWTSEHLFAKK